MEDELITLKTAILAKDKGFNILCFYHYSKDNKLIAPYSENESSTDTEFRVDLEDLLENHNYKFNNTYSAPTQSLLQRWLREKYNIHICINWDLMVGEPKGFYTISLNYIQNQYYSDIDENLTYKTYEEALEVALQEALKLIKL